MKLNGRNGSGKSSLLKVCSGQLDLVEGKMQLEDGNAVVYMDQSAGDMLSSSLTIGEQLKAFSSPNIGSSTQFDVMGLLAQFELDLQHQQSNFIGHLSGGQKQIIALLSVLSLNPAIVCLDEFMSALDTTSIKTASRILQYFNSDFATTIILVSHLDSQLAPTQTTSM